MPVAKPASMRSLALLVHRVIGLPLHFPAAMLFHLFALRLHTVQCHLQLIRFKE